ncbi:MAG: hypothetical protein M5U34_20835 [Chloroflexi bacterium]|nr:hypothetical protein [Chloroflexota bacterium]
MGKKKLHLIVMKIIALDSEDDIISICDRLDWAGEKQVLLTLPEDGGVLAEGLDLVRLRRHADRRRIEGGAGNGRFPLSRQAKALGLPTFVTIESAQTSRRGWWRGRRRSEIVGLPTIWRYYARPIYVRSRWRKRIKKRRNAGLRRSTAPVYGCCAISRYCSFSWRWRSFL